MQRDTNLSMGVRLALLQEGGADALVFESARVGSSAGGAHPPPTRAVQDGSSGLTSPFAAAAGAAPDVTVRELSLDNTLLGAAVRARWGSSAPGTGCNPSAATLPAQHAAHKIPCAASRPAPPRPPRPPGVAQAGALCVRRAGLPPEQPCARARRVRHAPLHRRVGRGDAPAGRRRRAVWRALLHAGRRLRLWQHPRGAAGVRPHRGAGAAAQAGGADGSSQGTGQGGRLEAGAEAGPGVPTTWIPVQTAYSVLPESSNQGHDATAPPAPPPTRTHTRRRHWSWAAAPAAPSAATTAAPPVRARCRRRPRCARRSHRATRAC
jgi:hypothetical protein